MKIKACLIIALALASSVPASADNLPENSHSEIAVGVLEHGVRKPFRGPPPPGFDIYEGEEEQGSVDIQVVYRSRPLGVALKPRLTARVQVNTAGDTNFASIGAEWRQHVLRGRVYGQVGIGLALHDGYRFTPNPLEPGLSTQEALRRFELEATRTSFGSSVLFNPNLSVGVRLTDRITAEAAFEHFSHAGLFGEQNPGINNIGIRVVVALGK